MAFQSGFHSAAFNNQPAAAGFTKAGGFINMYLTRADGSKVKVGAIALREDEEAGAFLLQALEAEDGVKRFANKVEFEYRKVLPNDQRPAIVL